MAVRKCQSEAMKSKWASMDKQYIALGSYRIWTSVTSYSKTKSVSWSWLTPNTVLNSKTPIMTMAPFIIFQFRKLYSLAIAFFFFKLGPENLSPCCHGNSHSPTLIERGQRITTNIQEGCFSHSSHYSASKSSFMEGTVVVSCWAFSGRSWHSCQFLKFNPEPPA